MAQSNENMNFAIFNIEMTVEAMRDSGYKSTTHALAEIIDNAIEAGAEAVELFGVSRLNPSTGRRTLAELAVLDDGSGMDFETLRGALRYGFGTRREREGMGRFGVGLPNASMSQARCLDVWSWQSGVSNSLRTSLSIAAVKDGATEIAVPELCPIPEVYLRSSINGFSDSGTLVVWSELDRVEWKRVETTFRHTEALLGRAYRRFLASRADRLHKDDPRGRELGVQRTITCIPIVDVDGEISVSTEAIVHVRPNDPLYLMSKTLCPEDFGEGPMFTELDGSPFVVSVPYRGESHDVRIRASYVRAHARDAAHEDASWPSQWENRQAGHTPWGKDADHNMGVSIVRAHREIEMDSSWINGSDPTERWWTVEVDFPTALDEVFGVTNNKQGTMTFQRLAHYDWKREAQPDEETAGDVRRRMEEDGDPRVHLLEIRHQIELAIRAMRPRIKRSRKQRSRHELDEDQKADAKATAAIKRRIIDGHKGESDVSAEPGDEEAHADAQVKSLVERHHFDRNDAISRVAETMETGNRVRWIQSAQESPAFFDVEPLPGVIQVVLNTNHPVHAQLYEIMHPEVDDLVDEELRDRIASAAAAFRILIYSWARYEEEQTEGDRRRVRNSRWEWGKYAEEFFDDEGDLGIVPTDLL